MAEPMINTSTKRYAVVTGAYKGIGLEICRQLASNGILVVLTARDEKKGLEALENFKESDLSDHVVFHQLDVADPSSIHSLAEFVKNQFGKLDILVNNAGVTGGIVDGDALIASVAGGVTTDEQKAQIIWRNKIISETYEATEECLQINFYGAKRMIEAFLPLLHLSDSPRIVNVSSSMGKLTHIPNEWAKGVLSDGENLTEEKVEEVLNVYLKDFKEGCIEAKSWPPVMSAYIVSKAAVNVYTRIAAKKYPNIIINSVCPGYVKTDLNFNTGMLSLEEGAQSPVRLALLPDGAPSGLFFDRNEVDTFEG